MSTPIVRAGYAGSTAVTTSPQVTTHLETNLGEAQFATATYVPVALPSQIGHDTTDDLSLLHLMEVT